MFETDLHPSWRSELDATLRLAVPLALAGILQMATSATDVIFVARLGEQALAAASLGVAIFAVIVWSLSAFTGAVAALIAAELGRRRHAIREVRRSTRMALWLALICAAGGMLLCAQGERFMVLTGQDPAVAARAGEYLHILLWAMPAMILANVLRSFVSALGRPIYATVITGLGVVVNCLGNYVLVFGHFGAPALGLDGAAIATVFASLATFADASGGVAADTIAGAALLDAEGVGVGEAAASVALEVALGVALGEAVSVALGAASAGNAAVSVADGVSLGAVS